MVDGIQNELMQVSEQMGKFNWDWIGGKCNESYLVHTREVPGRWRIPVYCTFFLLTFFPFLLFQLTLSHQNLFSVLFSFSLQVCLIKYNQKKHFKFLSAYIKSTLFLCIHKMNIISSADNTDKRILTVLDNHSDKEYIWNSFFSRWNASILNRFKHHESC